MRSALKAFWARRGRLRPLRQAEAPQNVSASSQLNNSQNEFRHTPLPGDRYIRLLRIIHDGAKSISVTVHTFPLEQLPDYEALSYTWAKAICVDGEDDNSPGSTYEIRVNARSFTITENLYDGLLELRNDITGYLWVDALCIDQTNMQERVSQVLLMGDIYSSARRVIIWLGKLIPEVEDVKWLEEKFLPTIEDDRFPAEEANIELLQFLGISMGEWVRLWGSHGKFYSIYRWFGRAWVFQEFILAREITMRCGERSMSYESLSLLSNMAFTRGMPTFPDGRRFMGLEGFRSMLSAGTDSATSEDVTGLLSPMTGAQTAEEYWYGLLFMLTNYTRQRGASKPHDILYAVFGIAQRFIPTSLYHNRDLIPDYEQSVEEAFLSFAGALLKHLPKLAVLSNIGGMQRKLETLPSWCPDYTTSPNIVSLSLGFWGPESIGGDIFMATKSLKRENGPCQITGRALSVSGKRVERITNPCQLLEPLFSFEHGNVSKIEILQGLFEACLLLEPIYKLTGQDRVEALCRALLLKPGSFQGQACEQAKDNESSALFVAFISFHASVACRKGKEEEKRCLDVIEWIKESFKASCVDLPTAPTIMELARSMEDEGKYRSALHTSNLFHLRAQPWGSGRRLFTTSQKWLGLGPESLEQDDEVWLLKNADVPFILRPYGESQYKIVGEAYVHGIMRGELIDAPGGSEGFEEIQIV